MSSCHQGGDGGRYSTSFSCSVTLAWTSEKHHSVHDKTRGSIFTIICKFSPKMDALPKEFKRRTRCDSAGEFKERPLTRLSVNRQHMAIAEIMYMQHELFFSIILILAFALWTFGNKYCHLEQQIKHWLPCLFQSVHRSTCGQSCGVCYQESCLGVRVFYFRVNSNSCDVCLWVCLNAAWDFNVFELIIKCYFS